MEWKDIPYFLYDRSFVIWVGEHPQGYWMASYSMGPSPVGAAFGAAPGEGHVVSGEFETEDAAIEAAKRAIDEKYGRNKG
jgi:hypothetical protein